MPLVRRLAVLAALLGAAAAFAAPALAVAPQAVVAPSISGRPDVGQVLTGDKGQWSGTPPLAFTYLWQRCNVNVLNCTNVGAATTYTVQAQDAGQTIKLTVTATNADGAVQADAAPVFISAYTLGTEHFLVHYLAATAASITQTQAGDVAGRAEQAYAAEIGDGYPAPLSDGTAGGDGRIDIYVSNLSGSGALGYAVPDGSGPQTSGYILLDGTNPSQALDLHTIAHELFHLVQFGVWLPTNVTDYWLLEGSAEWMGFRVDGYQGDLDLGNWEMALDCRDPYGAQQCDLKDAYKNGGYSRWPFFEYVTERWGAPFVKNVFDQGAAGASSAAVALANQITAKGGSLADTFTDWAVANATGSYTISPLQTVSPPAYSTPIETGTLTSLNALAKPGAAKIVSGAIPALKVPVNHLSARYVQIERGNSNAPDTPCYAATLTLNVSYPSATGARPYFWWSQRKSDGTNLQQAQALTTDGKGHAAISLPWDTCDWGKTTGYLILSNPSTSLDGQNFEITGTLAVDRNTEASPTAPPDPVKLHGNDVDVAGGSSTDPVPQVAVFGPQVLQISPAAKEIRLIVSSDGSGRLKAALGSLALGTRALRAGGNDLRFPLPTKALKSIRKVSAAANLLTLTPLSTSGAAAGKAITRRVVVRAPAKTHGR